MATILQITPSAGFSILTYLDLLYKIAVVKNLLIISEKHMAVFHNNDKETLCNVELIINNAKETYYFIKDIDLSTNFSERKFKLSNISIKEIRINNFYGNINLHLFPTYTKCFKRNYEKFVKRAHEFKLSSNKIIQCGKYDSKYGFNKWYSYQLSKYEGPIEERIIHIKKKYSR